jgi:hypothetical protein
MIGLVIWGVVMRPRPLTWALPLPIDPSVLAAQRLPRTTEPWTVLLPSHWLRWGVRRIQWLTALCLAGITGVITWNIPAALAFGWIGYWLPETILRDIAWSRWGALDRAAYATIYSTRFYLDQGTPVLQTWRLLIPKAQPVFRQWIEPCLIEENRGQPFEQTLKTQALAIRHAELAVTADILTVERRHGGAAGSLGQLLEMWGHRIELDADRRGSLAGFIWIGRVTLITGMVMFWGLSLGDAAVRTHMHTTAGGVVMGLSAVFLALGMTLYYRQNRAAERF